MARAHRHIIPGQVWHLSHRCHEKKWLLRFAKDRRRWLYWLYEARKRYGLVVLNYVITCNHILMLVRERGIGEIGRSMQLIAGRTAQEYNKRKSRRGADWEDRYHSTAVQTINHLHRCIIYIDLNMVRAGAVDHPIHWVHGGYAELQSPACRYQRIDYDVLMRLLGMNTIAQMQQARAQWLVAEMNRGPLVRLPEWTEAVAVGSESYIKSIMPQLTSRNPRRKLKVAEKYCLLQESPQTYNAFTMQKTQSKHQISYDSGAQF